MAKRNLTPSPSDRLRDRILETYRGVPVVWTMPLLNNRYHVFDIDMTVLRQEERFGLKEWLESRGVEYCTFLAITEVSHDFTYRINDSKNPSCDAVVGDEWENFEIYEIYISNTVGVGHGQFHIEWRAP